MTSFINLLKVFLLIYLGIITYILYQIIFYRQKKFLFLKTIVFFFVISIMLIYVSNKYDIILFHSYLIFFFLGVYLGKNIFFKNLKKHNKELNKIIIPVKLHLKKIIKIITIPPLFTLIKNRIKTYKYYKNNPHLKPKSIYDLF